MKLDVSQRLQFAQWCREQWTTCDAIADQIEKLTPNDMVRALANRERQKAIAFAIVATELAATCEEMSVSRVSTHESQRSKG